MRYAFVKWKPNTIHISGHAFDVVGEYAGRVLEVVRVGTSLGEVFSAAEASRINGDGLKWLLVDRAERWYSPESPFYLHSRDGDSYKQRIPLGFNALSLLLDDTNH